MDIAPNVFLARIGDRAIALDLGKDRYTALAPTMTSAVFELVANHPASAVAHLDRAKSALLSQGILAEGLGRSAERRVPQVTETLWPSEISQIAPHTPAQPDMMRILGILSAVWFSLKTRRFSETVSWVESQRIPSAGNEIASESILLDRYFYARPWFPVKPICRLDAIALCLYMRRSGLFADLVFGVRLDPFKAHCWTQSETRVLNEPHEVIRRFTPIMVV